jgi:hypothetical protein
MKLEPDCQPKTLPSLFLGNPKFFLFSFLFFFAEPMVQTLECLVAVAFTLWKKLKLQTCSIRSFTS